MIKISIKQEEIIISGHANYDDYGKDIVCASVSSIAITTINAVAKFNDSISYEEREGYLKIIINYHTKETDLLVENMIELLKNLEQLYKKNIKIN